MIYAVIILYVLVAFLWLGIYNANKTFSRAITNLHNNQQNLKRKVNERR